MRWLQDHWFDIWYNVIPNIVAAIVIACVVWSSRKVFKTAKDIWAAFKMLDEVAEQMLDPLRVMQTKEERREYIFEMNVMIDMVRDIRMGFLWKLICV